MCYFFKFHCKTFIHLKQTIGQHVLLLHSVSHDPFLQNMVLIFYMLIPYHFENQKSKAVLYHKVHGPSFILYLDNINV